MYIETSINNHKDILDAKLKFITKLTTTIGEQKIDVIIKSNDLELPIYNLAKTEGILLL